MSHLMRHLNISNASWLAIFAFTYVLSHGVGNMVEGINAFRTKHRERLCRIFKRFKG